MRVVEPNFELVRTKKLLRSELIILLPFHARSTPSLPAEESAFGRIRKQPVRVVALGRHIGVEFFETELRSQNALFSGQITMLCVRLISTLVKIWG